MWTYVTLCRCLIQHWNYLRIFRYPQLLARLFLRRFWCSHVSLASKIRGILLLLYVSKYNADIFAGLLVRHRRFVSPAMSLLFFPKFLLFHLNFRNTHSNFLDELSSGLCIWPPRAIYLCTSRVRMVRKFCLNNITIIGYLTCSVFGGLSGAFFVLCHRKYVLFMRNNKIISAFLQKK